MLAMSQASYFRFSHYICINRKTPYLIYGTILVFSTTWYHMQAANLAPKIRYVQIFGPVQIN
jgi:hypothetical protein